MEGVTRIFIDTHNPRSASARRLARALGARRIKHEGSRYRPRPTDLVINWGANHPHWDGGYPVGMKFLNPYANITIAQDKLLTFLVLKEAGVSIPEYTIDLETAKEWAARGRRIVSRSLLRASEGRGMVVGNEPLETIVGVPVKLWVHYRPKPREYRVHVFNKQVIDVQQKKRRLEAVDADRQIRSYSRGWVFARDSVESRPEIELIKQQAVLAVGALGLDFGAVDLIWNEGKQKCWTLEVNTAPGLINTTVQKYKEAILNYVHANESTNGQPQPTNP